MHTYAVGSTNASIPAHTLIYTHTQTADKANTYTTHTHTRNNNVRLLFVVHIKRFAREPARGRFQLSDVTVERSASLLGDGASELLRVQQELVNHALDILLLRRAAQATHRESGVS